MANDERHLTSRQRQDLRLNEAHGKAHVLAIGISDYNGASDYQTLKQCSQDAIGVADAFRDVHQLNANFSKIIALTSKHENKPSKGLIIREIRKLADEADEQDRLIFFFSGHGDRIGDEKSGKLFLVPQDVYAREPESLIDFEEIKKYLNTSRAKQKLIILDACFSGPDTSNFKTPTSEQISKSFLEKFLTDSQGIAILASSENNQSSTVQSPNPEYSLFTHFLIQALRGDPKALDENLLLTVDSLFKFINLNVIKTAKSYGQSQRPVISQDSNGFLMIGNFSESIAPPDSIDLVESATKSISFADRTRTRLKDWTSFKFAKWSEVDFIEARANEGLAKKMELTLGEIAAKIANALGFQSSQITHDSGRLEFPGGEYELRYKAKSDDLLNSGYIVHKITLSEDWIERPDKIPLLVKAIGLYPTEMTIVFNSKKDPEGFEAGLKAKGWITKNIQSNNLSFSHGTYILTVRQDSITLTGFSPSEVFGKDTDKKAVNLAGSVIQLLASGRSK